MPTADLFKVLLVVILVVIALAAFVTAIGAVDGAGEFGRAAFAMLGEEPVSSTGAVAEGYSPLAIVGAVLGTVLPLEPDGANMGFDTIQAVLFGGIALLVAFAAWGIAVKIFGGK